MNATHYQVLGIFILYCAVIAWMSVPFVTTDRDLLRRQVMFIDNLQEQIVADSTVTAALP